MVLLAIGPPIWNTSKVKLEAWHRGERYILSIIEVKEPT